MTLELRRDWAPALHEEVFLSDVALGVSEDRKATFDRLGFLVVPGFFDAAEMPEVIAEIQRARPRNGASPLSQRSMTFYSNVFFNSSKLQKRLSHPKVIQLLAPLVGPDFFVRWDQAVAKAPGAGDFGWHQDNGYSGLTDGYVQLWIALTDMTPDNGGLWLQPGSHKSHLPHITIDNHRQIEGVPENPVFISAKAGDVVVFSSMTLHTTTPNITDGTRWAYVAEYMSLDCFDPTIKPPYFVVARGGKPSPGFVRHYRGSLRVSNWLQYRQMIWGKTWSRLMSHAWRRLPRAPRRPAGLSHHAST